ncbi:MAG: hypothetical protein ACLP7F_12580 [Acidimicrobiales bacterium]
MLKTLPQVDDLIIVPAADGPPAAGAPAGLSRSPDLSAESWWAAERRRAGTAGQPGAVGAAGGAALSGDARQEGAGQEGAGPHIASTEVPAWRRRQRWLPVTRLWAVLKMASLAYTTWWGLGYIHARLAAEVCGWGGVCLFAGIGGHWRRRFFGPGQLMEPELYEEIGRWLYRIGTVLVLAGGALLVAQAATH